MKFRLILIIGVLIGSISLSGQENKNIIDLNGWWKMDKIRPGEGIRQEFHKLPSTKSWYCRCYTDNWINGYVPGDVFTDLWRGGVIDDPYFARNIERTKWLREYEFWYTKLVILPNSLKGKHMELVFEGVDYECDVWFNGTHLGGHKGAFVPFSFDVTDLAEFDSNNNRVTVKIAPPPRNRGLIAGGKAAHSNFGGDYMREFLMMGIHKSVRIETSGSVRITDLYMDPVLEHDGSALVTAKVDLENNLNKEQEVLLELEIKGKNFDSEIYRNMRKVNVQYAGSSAELNIEIEDPELWWTWDMGKQNLYDVSLRVSKEGRIQDEASNSFGIRKIEREMNPGFTEDQVEYPWTFVINGKRIYLRGASWSGPDLMYGRTFQGKYQKLIRLVKEANINHLRAHSWHPPEIEEFYDLCDQYGITVLQLFPFSTVPYPDSEEFREEAQRNCIGMVKERRHHPCLILWCGGDELGPSVGNKKLITAIGEAIKPYTDVPYIPMSPLSTQAGPEMGFKSHENVHATSHWYSAGKVTIEEYYNTVDYAMVSEIVEGSAPNVSSIQKFIPNDELWPPGPSWGYHFGDIDILANHNLEVFGDFRMNSIEEFVTATQIAEGAALKYSTELFRRNKYHTSASTVCRFDDSWPMIKWGIVDYYMEPKESYFMVKESYQPILPSLKYNKRNWRNGEEFSSELWVINDFHKKFPKCTLNLVIRDKEGNTLKEFNYRADVGEDTVAKVAELKWMVPEQLKDGFNIYIALLDRQGEQLSSNSYEAAFLVGDEELARQKLKENSNSIFDNRKLFGTQNNYYSNFPELFEK